MRSLRTVARSFERCGCPRRMAIELALIDRQRDPVTGRLPLVFVS